MSMVFFVLDEIHGVDIKGLANSGRPIKFRPQPREVADDLGDAAHEVPELPTVFVADLLDGGGGRPPELHPVAERLPDPLCPLLREKLQLVRIRPTEKVPDQVALGRVAKLAAHLEFRGGESLEVGMPRKLDRL